MTGTRTKYKKRSIGGEKMNLELPVQRYRLVFAARAGRATPAFAGNVWRGAFGHALRDAACLTGAPSCLGCARRAECAYAYVFETPPPANAALMRLYPNAPHPFVLRELTDQAAGTATLQLTLVGRAQALLALVVQALRQAAQGTHGIDGERLSLREVQQEAGLGCETWQRIDCERDLLRPLPSPVALLPAAPEAAVRLRFITPLRVKREGNAVGAQALDFGALFGTLMRRVSMLQAFHTDTPLQAPFAELAARSREVRMRSHLEPAAQQRFSNRQRRAMPMNGLLGWVELDAVDAQAFWPFLWLGQFVHAGSATTMGLGCYEIEPAATAGMPAQAASLPALSQAA